VDVEDWFHVCGHPEYSDPATWGRREARVHVGTERLLEVLAPTPSKATFFVLGWVARRNPALVKRIAAAGHEIGCHGDLHRRVFEMTPEDFRADLVKARDTLQDILGRSVTIFRAPEWSMRTPDNPALAILVEEGFTLDSSITSAPPVGAPGNPTRPCNLKTPSGDILEVPPLMGTFFFRRALWGGGVCSRMTQERRIHAAIERALADGVPPVLYCHPWELDDAHPPMPGLSLVKWLVKFAGRRRTEPRLKRLLARYTFQPISSARENLRGFSSKVEERKDAGEGNRRGVSSKGEERGNAA
jgi:polysaccharide deacetylase family protein (PEP-CTERM system associated)